MKRLLLSISLLLTAGAYAQTAVTYDFTGTTLDSKWQVNTTTPAYALSQNEELIIIMNDSVGPQQPGGPAENWQSFWFNPISPSIDMRTNKHITLDIDASSVSDPNGFRISVQPQDASGAYADQVSLQVAAGYVGSLDFNYTNLFKNIYGPVLVQGLVDSSAIVQLNVQLFGANLGSAPWNRKFKGNITLDNIVIGGVLTSSASKSSLVSYSKIFPNPASDEATVELELKSNSNLKVEVKDMMGKELMVIAEGNYTSLSKKISTSALAKGSYIVSYYIDGAIAKSELLMVK